MIAKSLTSKGLKWLKNG